VKQPRHGHRRSVTSAPNRPPARNHASPAIRVPPNRHLLSLSLVSDGTPIRPESDAKHGSPHASLAARSSCTATFRRADPLCLFLPTGRSQRHSLLRGLLIRRPHTSLEFTSDHTGLYLLTRKRLQSADVFLRPRTQFRSLHQLSSLIHHSCRPSVAVSKTKEPRICGALDPLYSITNKMPHKESCGYA